MLKPIFTLDYEIHGNGAGYPQELMVEPTNRLMTLFEEHGAKLTIMADVAEIIKFKEYAERHGKDDYHYESIVAQLRDAIRRGHDVQLHLHSSFLKAHLEKGRWVQDWSEYNLAELGPDRLVEVIRLGKEFLVELLKSVNPGYECIAFRAANWSMSPSRNVIRALLANDIRIDSSVFKYGRREGLVNFDYSLAHSHVLPWPASEQDICLRDEQGELWEYPIYTERRWIWAFLTPTRVNRALVSRQHSVGNDAPAVLTKRTVARRKSRFTRMLALFLCKHAWKADFNQCSGRQLIKALNRCEQETRGSNSDVPFVLIGHSKLFTRFNEKLLRPFLAYVAANSDRFGFSTLGQVHATRELRAVPSSVVA